MNYKKAAALSMLIIPWFTVPFLSNKSFVRFLPVASFAYLSIIVLSVIANRKKKMVEK